VINCPHHFISSLRFSNRGRTPLENFPRRGEENVAVINRHLTVVVFLLGHARVFFEAVFPVKEDFAPGIAYTTASSGENVPNFNRSCPQTVPSSSVVMSSILVHLPLAGFNSWQALVAPSLRATLFKHNQGKFISPLYSLTLHRRQFGP